MNKMLTLWACLALPGLSVAVETRVPSAVGIHYPRKVKDLAALADGLGLSTRPAEGRVVALLVPHAGLEFTGEAAAKAYRLEGEYDTILVVGAGHHEPIEGAALYPGRYATPEGPAPYDESLAKALLAASPLITEDAKVHEKDQSIEVQLPLLRRRWPKAAVVALLMNTQDLETSRAVGRAIASAAKGRRLLLVASSDMAHYPDGATADAVDASALAALATMDPAFFWLTDRFLLNRSLPNLSVVQCGEGALSAVMSAAAALGADRFTVTAKLNSGDVVSERTYNHVVGHASGAFLETKAAPQPPVLSPEERTALLDLAAGVLSGKVQRVPLAPPSQPRLNLPAAVTARLKDRKGRTLGESGSREPEETLIEAAVRHSASAAKAAGKRPASELILELGAPFSSVLRRPL